MASDSKTRLLREAEKRVLQGKLTQAIGEYLKIIKADPDDVLILNTVGDLYLRQKRTNEANKLFFQVAESYIRNNFLHKAIAVYKKILASDPSNLGLNTTIAQLYARQGMNVDARIQYMHVAEMCAKQGKTAECLDAYEKVVELDPMNFSVQLKLADIYGGQDNKSKAHFHLLGAARAQSKSGALTGAMQSYQRALEFDPHNAAVLKGLLETALQLGEVGSVLEQLSVAVSQAPEGVEVRELLGRAFLAANDIDSAVSHFTIVLASDESRVDNFLMVSRTLLDTGDTDRAAQCLEPALPILIGHREPDRILDAYKQILEREPAHIPSLKKLADIYSAINDERGYLRTMDRLADFYAKSDTPAEALSWLARILECDPDSTGHQRLHREIFAQVYPDAPYVPPVEVVEDRPHDVAGVAGPSSSPAESGSGAAPALIEIDLLLNYGMKDKALSQLLELEAQDPLDKQVRSRLISIYKDNEDFPAAAQQCILCAALERKAGKDDAAENLLAEAKKLAPESMDTHFDLASFAEKRGIPMGDSKARSRGTSLQAASGMEMDLSGDLSEIFFRDGAEVVDLDEMEVESIDVGAAAEAIASEIPGPSVESVAEQLQEVDFYIRLGFNDEAKAKLAEIARDHPGHPELASRLQQLGEGPSEVWTGPVQKEPAAAPHPAPEDLHVIRPHPDSDSPAPTGAVFPESELPESAAPEQEIPVIRLGLPAVPEALAPEIAAPAAVPTCGPAEAERMPQLPAGLAEICEETGVNEMFTDLIREVNALTDHEIAREDFETHFSLGIAYREMNLVDDAIREFQGAVKALNPEQSPRELVQCCGMLSTCFLDRGMPRSAIRWCQTGLSLNDISTHEQLALQYDMAVAQALCGDGDRALENFSEIFGVDPAYRDVAQRIDDLKAGHVEHAPPDHT